MQCFVGQISTSSTLTKCIQRLSQYSNMQSWASCVYTTPSGRQVGLMSEKWQCGVHLADTRCSQMFFHFDVVYSALCSQYLLCHVKHAEVMLCSIQPEYYYICSYGRTSIGYPFILLLSIIVKNKFLLLKVQCVWFRGIWTYIYIPEIEFNIISMFSLVYIHPSIFSRFSEARLWGQGVPRPDEICNPSSVLWVCPGASATVWQLLWDLIVCEVKTLLQLLSTIIWVRCS